MKGFQEKRRFKRILYSNFSILLLILVIVLLARAVWSGWDKYNLTRRTRQESEAKLNDLTFQKNLIEERTNKLESDRGKEEVLRERFDIGKEGEGLINVVGEKP